MSALLPGAVTGASPNALPGAAPPSALDAANRFVPAADGAGDELGQADFLKLMLIQVEQQDPFEPTSNGDFIAQMAQFSTVSGIEDMQASLERMSASFGAQQTLEASSLVGRDVLVAGDAVSSDGTGASGRYALERAAASATLLVHDEGGALVARRELGAQRAGRHDFAWDGRDDGGDALPAGPYRVSVVAGDADGGAESAVETLLVRRVEAVEFGAGGAVLMHTDDGAALGLDALREIRAPGAGTAADTAPDTDPTPDSGDTP